MKFIQINGLNQKYKLLLLYVTICSICFGIARLSGIVAPFDCDFFDSICQLIIFIPLLLYKTIAKKGKLSESIKKTNFFGKNDCKDYAIFVMMIILNVLFDIIMINLDCFLKNTLGCYNYYIKKYINSSKKRA